MIKWKSGFWLLSVLALCALLAACGGEKAPAVNNDAEKTVYTSAFTELFRDSRSPVSVLGWQDGTLYVSRWDKVGEAAPEGVTADYEGQYDIEEPFLYRIGPDGDMVRLAAYQPLGTPDGGGRKGFYAGCELCGLCPVPDGFVTVELQYAFWYDGDEEYDPESEEQLRDQRYEQTYYLRRLDRDGQELSRAVMAVPEEAWLSTDSMLPDSAGNLLLLVDGTLCAFGMDGAVVYTVESDITLERLLRLPDGRIALLTDGNTGKICLLDEKTRTLAVGGSFAAQGGNAIAGAGGYDICYTDGDGFYACRLGAEKPDRLFSLTDVNISSLGFTPLSFSDDGTVTGVVSSYNENTDSSGMELVRVARSAAGLQAQKQVIRLAAMNVDADLQQQVIDFNRRSDRCRIEIADYSVYGSNQDGGGETILNTEILSGRIPDIICLNSLNYRKLAGMGILEDLYPWLDADVGLDRSDFFPNVLAAREVDGKLCSTVPGFYIRSVIGAASVVGDTPGWTYDDFRAALASMPAGCTAFDRTMTRSDILSACLELDLTDYVDWETGAVRFDSPGFISLLEFAASFPSEEDWESGGDDFRGDDTGSRLAQGSQMLVQTGACGLEDILFNNYSQFLGGKITYIGYPTLHGTGNMFSFDEEPTYAMCSSSAHKDAVWEFLRVYFTEDYQDGELSFLPSRTDVFEKRASDAASVRYQKNSEGRLMLDAKGEKIPLARYYIWNAETGRHEPIYAVSAEQVGQVRDMILSTTRSQSFDLSILNIVEEQAAPFFAGQRSAAEVARLVQSKVSLYVGEQF